MQRAWEKVGSIFLSFFPFLGTLKRDMQFQEAYHSVRDENVTFVDSVKTGLGDKIWEKVWRERR